MDGRGLTDQWQMCNLTLSRIAPQCIANPSNSQEMAENYLVLTESAYPPKMVSRKSNGCKGKSFVLHAEGISCSDMWGYDCSKGGKKPLRAQNNMKQPEKSFLSEINTVPCHHIKGVGC